MATIRKRGRAWQVQIRPAGSAPLTRTFKRKPLADAWARQIEAEIDRKGLVFNAANSNNITVGEMLTRYLRSFFARLRDQTVNTCAFSQKRFQSKTVHLPTDTVILSLIGAVSLTSGNIVEC